VVMLKLSARDAAVLTSFPLTAKKLNIYLGYENNLKEHRHPASGLSDVLLFRQAVK